MIKISKGKLQFMLVLMILLVIPLSYASSTLTTTHFSVHEPPAITLNTPGNDTTISNAVLNYTVSDPDGDGAYCDIYGDNQTAPTTRLNSTGMIMSGTYQYSWSGLAEQRYHWRINCTDTRGASSISDTYTFLFDINDPPYFTVISNITGTEGDLLNITVNASDPENDSLTYYYGYPFNPIGQWQTGYGDAGNYSVNVTVSDGTGNTTENIIVTVQNHVEDVNMSLQIVNNSNGEEYNVSLTDTGFNDFGNVINQVTFRNITANKTVNFSVNIDYYKLKLEAQTHYLLIRRIPLINNIRLILGYDEDVSMLNTDQYLFKKTIAIDPAFNHTNATVCFDMTRFTFGNMANADILMCSYSFITRQCTSSYTDLETYRDGDQICVDIASFSAFSLVEKRAPQEPGGGGHMGGGGMTTPGRIKEEPVEEIPEQDANITEEQDKYQEEPKIISRLRETPVIGKMLAKVPPIKKEDIRKEVLWFFLIGLISIGFISNYIYSYRSQAADMISELHRKLDEMLRKK